MKSLNLTFKTTPIIRYYFNYYYKSSEKYVYTKMKHLEERLPGKTEGVFLHIKGILYQNKPKSKETFEYTIMRYDNIC